MKKHIDNWEKFNETNSLNKNSDTDIKYYKKDGYVKSININGENKKEINVDGLKYRYNPTYKTYNSIKGNEILHKSHINKANEITPID